MTKAEGKAGFHEEDNCASRILDKAAKNGKLANGQPHQSPKQPQLRCHGKVQQAMQWALDKTGIPLTVIWKPNPNCDRHGEIEVSSGTLFLYDVDPQQAWETFQHELLEWKFKRASRVYRVTVNALIEALEKIVYQNKEQFLDCIPHILKTVEEVKASLK